MLDIYAMEKLLTFTQFIAEGKKGPTPAGNVMGTSNVANTQFSVNFADETLEAVRRNLYDLFIGVGGSKNTDLVNKCVSTIVYCLDKKMRIDADIIQKLADLVEKSIEEVTKMVTDEVNGFYGKQDNLYGRK